MAVLKHKAACVAALPQLTGEKMPSAPCPTPPVSIKPGEKFLSLGDVLEKTSFRSKTSIYDMVRSGDFVKPVQLFGRRVAFLESEVEAWMASRVALRNNQTEQDKK